jgi:hypothetical protein
VASRVVGAPYIAHTLANEEKKEFEAKCIKLFRYLVAGIGFEPMTFGL